MKISQLKHQIWLIDTILQNENIKRHQINEKWLKNLSINDLGKEYDRTTFNRDRKDISSTFGIEIGCQNDQYFIENKEDIQKNLLANWILNSFSISHLLRESQSLYHRILLEDIPSGRKYLGLVLEAMKQNTKIEFSYQRHQEENETKRLLSPFCVKIFNNRWYVIGQENGEEKAQAIRIFALDRIKSLQILAEKFQFPDDFDGNVYFSDCFGIFADRTILPEKIIIKATAEKSKYLKTLPLHHSQKELKTEGEFTFFEYFLRPTYDFRQEILLHGAEIEVILPESFRNEIKYITLKMSELYK